MIDELMLGFLWGFAIGCIVMALIKKDDGKCSECVKYHKRREKK